MKTTHLFYILFLTAFNSYAVEQGLSDEYSKPKQNIVKNTNTPFETCLMRARYEAYNKAYAECSPKASNEDMMIRCVNSAREATKKGKGNTSPSAHCDILKQR